MEFFSEPNAHRLIDQAIELNILNRTRFERRNYDSIIWAKDMCTVKIGIGRAVGITTYILQKVNEYRSGNIAIVRDRRSLLYEQDRNYNYSSRNVFTVDDVNNDCFRGMRIKGDIFVDDADRCFSNYSGGCGLDIIYLYQSILRDGNEHTFVLFN